MKKKLFFVLMICVVATVLAATLVGCASDTLASPRSLRVTDDGYLAWGAVEGADGYIVYFNDDESERFYLTDNYIGIYDDNIRSVLKSGEKNNVYIRAVTLNSKNLPEKVSNRSMIIFNYSRQLATPNKIKMSKDRFSWRGVTDATDYKALVRRSGESEGMLYDMTWSTGTASVTGTINDLPNGYMYYVSIVATAPGYENSEPSDEVPFDRTAANMDAKTYVAKAGEESFNLAVNPNDDNYYLATVTAKAGDAVTLADNAGTAYTVSPAIADNAGDYVVTLNVSDGTATMTAVESYYLYVNGEATATKFLLNAATNVYAVNVELKDGDNFLIKDGAGSLFTTFSDDSVNLGSAVTAGKYALSIAFNEKNNRLEAKVAIGTTDTGNSVPLSKDGMWAVMFDYNYDGAPSAEVVYITNNKTVPTPAAPLRAGYIFDGWYEDSYCMIAAAFGKKQSNFTITAPTTFYAKWTKDGTVVEHTVHVDVDKDGKCDECGKTMVVECTNHVDANGDGKCDICGAAVSSNTCTKHVDRDGDGLCDNCGTVVSTVVPVDTTGTLYLDVSDFAWFADDNANINVHIWYTDNTNNSFPGPKMTYNAALGYYEAEYYTSRTIKGVLFTRNNPNPNPGEGEVTEWDRVEISDFTFSADYPVYKLLTYYHSGDLYSYTGRWIKVGEQINTVGDGKVYLDFRDIDWFMEAASTNMVYIWYTDGSENAKFPGKTLTYTTDATSKRYSGYVDYFTDRTVAGIIFTRNDPNQELGVGVWNKIELRTEDGSLNFDPNKPAYRVTALGTSFEGYWETEADALSATANVVDTEDDLQTAYFYVNVSAVTWFGDNDPVVKAKITYTDGSVNDNAGVVATKEDGMYKWGYNGDKTVNEVLVLRCNPAGEGEVWNSFKVTLSEDATQQVVNVSSIEGTTAQYSFSKKAGADTNDETRTVYFTNNMHWTSAYGYAWTGEGSGKLELAAWPGVALTKVETNGDGDDVYAFTFSVDYENIIFNGMGGQTVDIALADLPAGKNAYYCDGQDENGKYLYGTWYRDDGTPTKTVASIVATYNGGDVTVGNSVSLSDISVQVTYSDDSTATVTSGFALGSYDKSTAGAKTIAVTYGGKSDNIQVTYVAGGAVVWDGTLTVDVTAFNDWFENDGGTAYLYVWYTDETKNAEWCGVAMTKVSKGIYTGTIDTAKTVEGFIIARSADGSTVWNQTDDLTTIPDNHTIVVTAWKE